MARSSQCSIETKQLSKTRTTHNRDRYHTFEKNIEIHIKISNRNNNLADISRYPMDIF